jgi:hypothetical protein
MVPFSAGQNEVSEEKNFQLLIEWTKTKKNNRVLKWIFNWVDWTFQYSLLNTDRIPLGQFYWSNDED